ncbi:hypothetical protein OU800_13350 [Pseudomonas sp. GOM7]|uniref:DUF2231 domain-containing protein n=1 Tax=Pseudomonas sp. GOM7 TaxID=2998079 RepID=UPI00227CA49F|nr:DUF2231 domain-containing protein [Pseudomonas sp. GOM7]WAJ35623.1 hypothetical protein OU800_13350 [Pseudomonas sp. GOM7]
MTTTSSIHLSPPNRLHAILLCGQMPLFLGALLSDFAYYRSYQIQWSNFASWLIAGGMVFAGLALLFALIDLFRERGNGHASTYFLLLLATWLVGLVNALEHAKDAWAAMPWGLLLSLIVALLACVATWVGLAQPRLGDDR